MHRDGQLKTEASGQDPRKKYGSRFPSDSANPYEYHGPARAAEQVAA